MEIKRLDFTAIQAALDAGWQTWRETAAVSTTVAAAISVIGLLIMGGLIVAGFAPFTIAAAGGFMLLGPILLAGFFGIAAALDAGRRPATADFFAGFRQASGGIWAIALVCGLLFLIFVTDAAILYSYMVGAAPVWGERLGADLGIGRFVFWGMVSGMVIALMLYVISAFSVPLLCDRRAGLVDAVVTSVRVVFGNLPGAVAWAFVLAVVMISSVFMMPLLPLTLPWLAYASRALYRRVLPPSRQA